VSRPSASTTASGTAHTSHAVPEVSGLAGNGTGSAWATLADYSAGRAGTGDDLPVHTRRVLLRVAVIGVIVLLLVAVVGLFASRRIAERQAVNDAASRTDLLVDTAVQPALTDGLFRGTPGAAAAFAKVIKDHVLRDSIVRVKLWAPDGRIVYSDEPRLIGQTFPLGDDEQAAFSPPRTHADVTDLSRPENRYEQSFGKLLEVYRPVWTPAGKPLLFETYSRYGSVSARSGQLWRGFAGITISSLLIFSVLLAPVLFTLLRRLRRAQAQREALLQHAVQASADERRRIAATVHDGVVQELVATSFALSGKAEHASAAGEPEQAAELHSAAASVRANIGSLRSLLVDIYPPNLRSAGLPAAIEDLANALRSRGIDAAVDIDTQVAGQLPADDTRLVFQVTQECLRNVVKHAGARSVTIALTDAGDHVRLDIVDDGEGFDVHEALVREHGNHFGLRLLADLASAAGARLRVASAEGRGTHWQLSLVQDAGKPRTDHATGHARLDKR
jgi:two-component system NarL family sensor kinase